MGEIRAEVTLENAEDRALVRRGHGTESEVRRTTVDGIVDTGAVTLMLPQNVVERLGLEPQGTAFVKPSPTSVGTSDPWPAPSRSASVTARWSPSASLARR